VALAPSLVMWCAWPRAFLFGNLGYPALNTEYRRATGFPRAMTVLGKVAYLFKDLLIFPGNLALFTAFVASLVGLWHDRRAEPHPNRARVNSLVGVIGALLVGSFAPTPLFPPYFFAPLPFMVLVVVLVAGDERKRRAGAPQMPGWFKALAVMAVVAVVPGLRELRYVAELRHVAEWTPLQVHEAGRAIARECGVGGRVLTFAPILSLEGGCTIYAEYATGPFAARVGGFVDEREEAELKEVDAEDLPEMLAARPPAGVLTGVEGRLDEPLEGWARGHEMTSLRLAGGRDEFCLWVPGREAHDFQATTWPASCSRSRSLATSIAWTGLPVEMARSAAWAADSLITMNGGSMRIDAKATCVEETQNVASKFSHSAGLGVMAR
jgi:hypothetical protein